MTTRNRLYYGDNLTIMQRMKGQLVDLIYLDPPFNSKQTYNLIYTTMTGKPVPDQADAFCDTWEMNAEKEELARHIPEIMKEQGVDDYYINFWRLWLGALKSAQSQLLAYLTYMVLRLLHMNPILKDTGSIYLHCDPAASHYIKVMMDGIFGHQNFRNEIIWKRTSAHSSAKRYGPVHDTILFYTKSDVYTWNKIFEPYDQYYLDQFYTHVDPDGRRWRRSDLTGAGVRHGETGKPWRGIDATAKNRHWFVPPAELDKLDAAGKIHWPAKQGGVPMLRRYADEQKGVPLQDVWTDIRPLHNLSLERTGYQTQKPIELMKRIIRASSNPGDLVFDPFCGCGSTVYAAQEIGRDWIGCDVAILAIRLIRDTLTGRYRLAENVDFVVDGVPVSVEQAMELFNRDKGQFQHWAVERAGGFPMRQKVADRGIDGRLYFEVKPGLKSMVLSVKGGGMKPADVRDLRGVLEREDDAEMAGLISLQEPSKAMKAEAATAGLYRYEGNEYPRIQLLTIREILEEKREFRTPTRIIGSRARTGQEPLPMRDRL